MITVVKIGGTILEDSSSQKAFLHAFSQLEGQKILIHGGGKRATTWAKERGIQPQFYDGRRITTPDMMEVALAVYSGINKELVSGLQHLGINAIGLCGADGMCVPAKRRPVKTIDFGLVGDPLFDMPLSTLISTLLENDYTPVFSALSQDVEKGELLNTNADTIALYFAAKLAEFTQVRLIYAFERAGVLWDSSDPDSVIPTLRSADVNELRDLNRVHSGMIPKLETGFRALELGASSVRITGYMALEAGTVLLEQA